MSSHLESDEVVGLREENARLRAALEEIIVYRTSSDDGTWEHMVEIAQLALGLETELERFMKG